MKDERWTGKEDGKGKDGKQQRRSQGIRQSGKAKRRNAKRGKENGKKQLEELK